MPKKIQNTFDYSNIYTRIFAFLINLPKDSHFKCFNKLLQVSLGHLSPDLHRFWCKIIFCKIFIFVKTMLQTILTLATFILKFSHFCLVCQKKRHLKPSDELLWSFVGHLSPDLHQFYCKTLFCKILNFVKKIVKMESRI